MDAPPFDPVGATPAVDHVEAPVESGGISTLLSDVRQLASDAKSLAEAELAFQVSRAKVAGEAAQRIAIYGIVAFLFAFFALGGLVVGLLLALTPLITAWGATAVVVGALLLGAFACVGAAARRMSRLRDALAGDEPGERE